jgi:hypothetical protein
MPHRSALFYLRITSETVFLTRGRTLYTDGKTTYQYSTGRGEETVYMSLAGLESMNAASDLSKTERVLRRFATEIRCV